MNCDDPWMQLALKEGRKGIGFTSPNPPVGAVIVKNNKLLGKGWHHRAGKPHAEREAIADALRHSNQEQLKDSTLYVTLEPCSSYGLTPPCTQGILDAGISCVIYGAEDPNPLHAGQARKQLEEKHVRVISGVCRDECLTLIRPFTKKQRTGLPWVILKSAMSLDGRITRPRGESQWLTSEASRAEVQQLRKETDAIITGGNTLRNDDPSLTIRPLSSKAMLEKEQPWRMIITRGSRESLPANAQVFNDAYQDKTLIQGNGDLISALKTLSNKGCNSVMVEAGGGLMGAFLEAGLADEVVIFYAPLLTGGSEAGFIKTAHNIKLYDQKFTRIGDDIMLRALITAD